MKYPKSVYLGSTSGPDGQRYRLDFYGEDEGAAVVSGPTMTGSHGMTKLGEVHREPAATADEARAKLNAWIGRTSG